eukprot:scaffold5138_cov251-Pinguiococcus_pyrenoidosus.AAC.10
MKFVDQSKLCGEKDGKGGGQSRSFPALFRSFGGTAFEFAEWESRQRGRRHVCLGRLVEFPAAEAGPAWRLRRCSAAQSVAWRPDTASEVRCLGYAAFGVLLPLTFRA